MAVPLQRINDPSIFASGVDLYVLRLDLPDRQAGMHHPHISGNKWYKLKYNLEEAARQGKDTVVTMGGAYSNHIAALAAAGKEHGFKTVGIVRGDELREKKNPNLQFAESCGMKLQFISREEFRNCRDQFPNSLIPQFPNSCFLPEGGSNDLAVKGCAEITQEIPIPFDHICCAVGTGATLAGIISSLNKNQQALGFSALADAEFLEDNVSRFLAGINPAAAWKIDHSYHFGRYARHTTELMKFISEFKERHSIPLEHVYTGKMMFGLYDLIRKGYFVKGETVVAIHTGGLQGKLD